MSDFLIKQTSQEEALSHFPEILYKYRDWENDYHKRIILNKELYFPCFSELNDEFDGKQPFKFYTENISFDDYKNVLKRNDKQTFEKISGKELKIMYDKFQSGQDWKNYYECHIKNVNNLYGVYSLSSTNINQQLWANYANNNKGFCIGFNTFNLYNSIKGYNEDLASRLGIDVKAIARQNNIEGNLNENFKPTISFVKYDDKPISITFGDYNIYQYQNLFFTKQKKWEYEEEIRLLKLFAPKKTFKIGNNVIREIIFGIHMPSEHKMDIIKKVEKAGFKNVNFFEITNNYETLAFDIKKHN